MKNDKDKKLNRAFENYDKNEMPDKSVLFAAKNELAQKNAYKKVKRKAWLKVAVPIFACLVVVVSLVSYGISKLFNSFDNPVGGDSSTPEVIKYYSNKEIGRISSDGSIISGISLDKITSGENITLLKEEYFALYFKNADGTLGDELAAVIANISVDDGGVKKDITLYLEYTERYNRSLYDFVGADDTIDFEDGEYVGKGFLTVQSVKCYVGVISPDYGALLGVWNALTAENK